MLCPVRATPCLHVNLPSSGLAVLLLFALGYIVAVDSVSPTVFCISETGDLIRWFDCSDYMREPSDIAVSGKEYFVCDFKVTNCILLVPATDNGDSYLLYSWEWLRSIVRSMSVCLSARISPEPRVIFTNFFCMLYMFVALSSSGVIAIRYVLPF